MRWQLLALAVYSLAALLLGGTPAPAGAPECIAPAKPGGGFDQTCQLVGSGLRGAELLTEPVRITYLPGGVGAVAYDAIVEQRPDEPDTLVAFSGGSLLNLALGKFGRYTEADVRWVAGIAMDCGVLAVPADSPLRNLGDLAAALKRDPSKVVFGVGGSRGGQDWMKAARLARLAGVDAKRLAYVSFEGGGEAFIALNSGHLQVVSADILEAGSQLDGGKIRVLAVFSEQRLPGKRAGIPTAREQGFPISWPDIRGVYLGPKVPDGDYRRWVETFERMLAAPSFGRLREERGLLPFSLTGAALAAYVKQTIAAYGDLAREFGLERR